jgi:hypothetical protein
MHVSPEGKERLGSGSGGVRVLIESRSFANSKSWVTRWIAGVFGPVPGTRSAVSGEPSPDPVNPLHVDTVTVMGVDKATVSRFCARRMATGLADAAVMVLAGAGFTAQGGLNIGGSRAGAIYSCPTTSPSPRFTLGDSLPAASFVVRAGSWFGVVEPKWGWGQATELTISDPGVVHEQCSIRTPGGGRLTMLVSSRTPGSSYISGTVAPASNLAMPSWSGLVTVISSTGTDASARHAAFCAAATRVVSADERNILTLLGSSGHLPARISAAVSRAVATLVRDATSGASTASSSTLADALRLLADRLAVARSPAAVESPIGAFASQYTALEAACRADFMTSVFATGPVIGRGFEGPEYFCAKAPLRGQINYVRSDLGAAALRVSISGLGRASAGQRVYVDWVSTKSGSPGQPVAIFVISNAGEVKPGSLVVTQVPTARAEKLDLYGSMATARFGQLTPCN